MIHSAGIHCVVRMSNEFKKCTEISTIGDATMVSNFGSSSLNKRNPSLINSQFFGLLLADTMSQLNVVLSMGSVLSYYIKLTNGDGVGTALVGIKLASFEIDPTGKK